MSPAPSDFVLVQLSAAGVAFAGNGGTVRVSNGHFSYTFTASKPVRVLTSEWSKALSKKVTQGQPILAIAPSASASAKNTKTVSPEASHTDAPAQTVPATATDSKTEVK